MTNEPSYMLWDSCHEDLQPDIRVYTRSSAQAERCHECDDRAIYYYGGSFLCRTHAAQVQAIVTRLRDSV